MSPIVIGLAVVLFAMVALIVVEHDAARADGCDRRSSKPIHRAHHDAG